MVRYRRNFLPGGTFFITATLLDRRSRVLVDRMGALRTAIRLTRRRHPFGVDAIVVLPDHLHMIMTLPDGDADFSIRWSLIKRRFTGAVTSAGMQLPRHANGEAALWQRRFWEHTIRDDRDFERHVDYIHFNPVKHGLVRRVCEWPRSSFHRYVRLGVLPRDWAGESRQVRGDFGERSR
ncbi:MAG: REP-associated tyrosine transposase [Xanthobacteraceae bacterium]